jgi:hypothetical protein
VDEQELESLWCTLRSGLLTQPHPYLEKGERVTVERGPLAGVEGIITEFKGSFRLVVAVTLLQRAVSAEMERDWIRPIRRSQSSTPAVPPASWPSAGTATSLPVAANL